MWAATYRLRKALTNTEIDAAPGAAHDRIDARLALPRRPGSAPRRLARRRRRRVGDWRLLRNGDARRLGPTADGVLPQGWAESRLSVHVGVAPLESARQDQCLLPLRP